MGTLQTMKTQISPGSTQFVKVIKIFRQNDTLFLKIIPDTMDCPKCVVSNQKNESICIQLVTATVNPSLL